MKTLGTVILVALLASGCMAGGGSNIPHEDSHGAVPADSGPLLCRDGTPPPCTPRS